MTARTSGVTEGGGVTAPHQKILVTNKEAADLCSMSLRTFQKKVSRGELPQPCIKSEGGTGNRWSVLQLQQHFAPNLNY